MSNITVHVTNVSMKWFFLESPTIIHNTEDHAQLYTMHKLLIIDSMIVIYIVKMKNIKT